LILSHYDCILPNRIGVVIDVHFTPPAVKYSKLSPVHESGLLLTTVQSTNHTFE